uniref:protein CASP-like n=1 Tax=Styela clava TaxID=7725 RepID=UPI00193A826A|nr:protein CASP-like [Styela clava]
MESAQKLEQQQQLIRQLEQDLIVMQGSSSTTYRPGPDGAPNTVSDMSSELVAGAVKQSTGVVADTSSGTDSLLAIVTSQRERFRVRNQELEAENYMLQQNYNRQQNELDGMRTDNVKLYEKIKFLQSYPSTKVQVQDDVTSKRYSTQYEEHLDPFTSFNKREKQRKYMNLGPHDKLTLNLGKFILSSKMARTVFFFYMLIVHTLLYIILYKYAYTEDCMRHIAELCYEKFGQPMVPNHLADRVVDAGGQALKPA